MKKKTKQLLAIVGAAAVGSTVAAVLYRKSADRLMTIALDRAESKDVQKSKQKLMNSEEYAEIFQMLNEKGSQLEAREHEVIEITSHDGLKLIGHWFTVPHAKRTVIAMHGWRSCWSRDFGAIADFWMDNGCNILFAEQRAQGGSDGEHMGFGIVERHDCLAWIHEINHRVDDELPLYLAGISMGASTVLMTAGFDLPDNVRGIIADCGFTSPHAIWKHVVQNNLHLPYGIYHSTAMDAYRKKLNAEADEYSCTQAMEQSVTPVLFIHGTDDHFVPVNMTFENYKACKAPKRLFVVPGADHGMSYLVDQSGYEAVCRAFWKDFDAPREDAV